VPELEADERALVERRDELVALACELIAVDTSSRSAPDVPPRDEARRAGQLVRRRDVRAGGAHARADVRPAGDRPGAHGGRARPDRRSRRVRAGIALAGRGLCA
jgi:hypothetical protein